MVVRSRGGDMRQATACALVGLLAAAFPLDRVWACGGKLLLTGRTSYERPYAAINPASVVIYLPRAATSHGAGGDLASFLRRAGHSAEVIGDVSHLAQSLGSGTVDVVIANVVHMPDAETALVDCPTRPVLLPIVWDDSPITLAAAKDRYGFAVKFPDTSSHFLGTIDKAMDKRQSHATRKKR
jgi:hypothetical protein